jgi:hypothetical protein
MTDTSIRTLALALAELLPDWQLAEREPDDDMPRDREELRHREIPEARLSVRPEWSNAKRVTIGGIGPRWRDDDWHLSDEERAALKDITADLARSLEGPQVLARRLATKVIPAYLDMVRGRLAVRDRQARQTAEREAVADDLIARYGGTRKTERGTTTVWLSHAVDINFRRIELYSYADGDVRSRVELYSFPADRLPGLVDLMRGSETL